MIYMEMDTFVVVYKCCKTTIAIGNCGGLYLQTDKVSPLTHHTFLGGGGGGGNHYPPAWGFFCFFTQEDQLPAHGDL